MLIFTRVLSQWDCVSLLNKGEYYGNVSTYCGEYGCDNICNQEGQTIASENAESQVCTVAEGDLFPECMGDFGVNVPCNVPSCHAHAGCYYKETNGTDYRGLGAHTLNGYKCIDWTEVPSELFNSSSYAELNQSGSYCRNPDNRAAQPWCFYRPIDGNQLQWTFCEISQCNSTRLENYRRIPDYYNTAVPRNPPGHTYRGTRFDDFVIDLEERCARRCEEETSYTCRQFYVAPITRYCEWLSYSEFSAGERVAYRYDFKGDVFIRKSTYCDGFIQNFHPDSCVLPLGMESGWISDANIEASSKLDEDHAPSNARLYGKSSWIPHPTDTKPYIKVTFPERSLISAILIQGDDGTDEPVPQSFNISFRVDGYDVNFPYRHETLDTEQAFSWNAQPRCVVQIYLPSEIWTHEIQIRPNVDNATIGLRLEFLGCRDNGCEDGLALSGDKIPNDKITASSFLDLDHNPAMARLNPFRRGGTGWIPASSAVDPEPYWQVDFDLTQHISGLITRICENLDGVQGWLSRFDLTWARLGFNEIRNDTAGQLLDLELQYGESSLARVYFNPSTVDTKVLRINPTLWSGNYSCLMLELIGCDYTDCSNELNATAIHRSQIANISCLGCDEETIDQWPLHLYASNGSSGVVFWSSSLEETKWLEFDFGTYYVIRGIVTQGGTESNVVFVSASDLTNATESFNIVYQYEMSRDNDEWREYKDTPGPPKVFTGLRDPFVITTHILQEPFLATRIRILLHDDEHPFSRFRFDFLGCKLTEPSQWCSGNEIVYDGYCLRVIDSELPGACDEVFSPGSYPLAIKSGDMQEFIRSNGELFSDISSQLVIGLTTDEDGSFTWADGTPALYFNFVTETGSKRINSQEKRCAFINLFKCFQWDFYDCVASDRATVCQADLDECLLDTHGCADICVNHDGGYHCECSHGFVLHGEKCSHICGYTYSGEPWTTGGDDHCIYTNSFPASWAEAEAKCSSMFSQLPDEDQFESLKERLQKNVGIYWLHDYSEARLAGCQAIGVSESGQTSLFRNDCETAYDFICLREFADTKIGNLLDNSTEQASLWSYFGFVQFSGYAPWYYTDSKILFEINAEAPDLKLSLDILQVSLRRSGSQCNDTLILRSAGEEDLAICGELEDLQFVLPGPVQLELVTGRLQERMPPMLGFTMAYEAVDCRVVDCLVGCGQTSLIFKDDVLATVPFPSSFVPFGQCETTLLAKPDQVIALTFLNYEVKPISQGSCDDSVSMRSPDWSAPLTFDCHTYVPPVFITNTSELHVSITLGLEVFFRGFQANVTFLDKPGCFESTLDQCGSSPYACSGSSGIIVSPNYPQGLDSPTECRWSITTSANSFILLQFVEASFPEREADCIENYIRVYQPLTMEIGDETSVLRTIGWYCNSTLPPNNPIDTHLNNAVVALKTTSTYGGISMVLEYEALYFSSASVETEDKAWLCPNSSESGKQWIFFGGSCYLVVQRPNVLTWVEASAACEEMVSGGHLVSIRDQEEADFLHYTMTTNWSVPTSSAVYIGLGKRNEKSVFRWTDGSPMSFTDWYIPDTTIESENIRPINQPDGSYLEHCVELRISSISSTALWHDIPCLASSTNQFVCKVQAAPPPGEDIFSRTLPELQLTSSNVSHECPATMFMCGTGECVHRVYLCDGWRDCVDNTDEAICTEDPSQCSVTSFTCSDGSCIPMSFYCDNVTHCRDGSDEFNCAPYNCSADEFRCDSGRCIPEELKCDLVDHCFDFSDEQGCSSKDYEKERDVVACFNGDVHPGYARCDGIVDCIGTSFEDEEESLCDYRHKELACNSSQITCANGVCSDAQIRCIYDIDKLGYVTGCRDVSHLRSCESFVCPEYTFKCPETFCIPLRFRCNGVSECPNSEDELACDRFACPPGTYSCRGSSVCLSPREVCDGFQHCPLADDELFCGVLCPAGCNCSGLTFVCEAPSWESMDEITFPSSSKKIFITSSTLRLASNNTHPASADHMNDSLSFVASRYPFLAELILERDGLTNIPALAFVNNPDLYFLSLGGNPILHIDPDAFVHLTKLDTLDLRNTLTPSNAYVRNALRRIPSLKTIYAESFAFCCMTGLAPAEESETTGCFAPVDQFSSCDDLLKDNTLRIFMWILGISALAGNLFVIGLRVFRTKAVAGTRVQSRLITNLAVSDLLMGIYMIIIATADQFYRGDYAIHADRWRNSIACKTAGFLSAFSSEVSVFLIMLISLDRVLCVVLAHRRNIQLSAKSSLVWIAILWTSALVLSLIPALPLDYFGQFYGRSSVCLGLPLTTDRPPGWGYSIAIFLGLNLACFTITALCYVAIFVTVHRSSAELSSAKHVKNASSMEIKLAARMAMIVGTDFVCWMPIIIMGVLSAAGAVEIPADMYAWTAVFILPLNSSLNPYLYTLSAVWQRHKAKRRARSLHENSQNTKMSIMSSPTRESSVRRTKHENTANQLLTINSILTPLNASSLNCNMPIVSLSQYINERGEAPSVVESTLIYTDIRKAINFLESKSTSGVQVTDLNIALQLDELGEIIRAFLVTTDPSIMLMSGDTDKLLQLFEEFPKQKESDQKMIEFMTNMADKIKTD